MQRTSTPAVSSRSTPAWWPCRPRSSTACSTTSTAAT